MPVAVLSLGSLWVFAWAFVPPVIDASKRIDDKVLGIDRGWLVAISGTVFVVASAMLALGVILGRGQL